MGDSRTSAPPACGVRHAASAAGLGADPHDGSVGAEPSTSCAGPCHDRSRRGDPRSEDRRRGQPRRSVVVTIHPRNAVGERDTAPHAATATGFVSTGTATRLSCFRTSRPRQAVSFGTVGRWYEQRRRQLPGAPIRSLGRKEACPHTEPTAVDGSEACQLSTCFSSACSPESSRPISVARRGRQGRRPPGQLPPVESARVSSS
jgi:hypothetical protein